MSPVSLKFTALLVVAILAVGAAAIRTNYTADMREAVARASSGSLMAATPCGPIEFAEAGEGPVVLVVHGAGGGHDQGMMFGRPLAARGYRVIAVSRFGYLRTPAPQNPSPLSQADAHACLLDALGVSRAAIIGASAGAPSAMQFAIRHPERCAALVLLVPLVYRPMPPGERAREPEMAMKVALDALESDFGLWTLLKLAPGIVTRTLLATPPQVLASSGSDERERISAIRESILPVSRRAVGLRIDGAIAASLPRYELESIRAPTLIFSLEDDLFDTYAGAQYTARQIAGARFIGFASGGHTWAGHHEEILAETARFMRPDVVTSAYVAEPPEAPAFPEVSLETNRADP